MNDAFYMQRCLQLAALGINTAPPNPLVGCVIVHNDVIIGEGWHYKAGSPHAEVNAIHAVSNTELLKESTVYVNLEPCAHFGKTPPCADLLIKHRVKKVVIGCQDSFAEVNGAGITKLKKANIEVVIGVLNYKAKLLNQAFFTFHAKKRPFILLKWAQTFDGFFDKNRVKDDTGINWITGEEAKNFTHNLRAKSQAILVGSNTINVDNPSLNTRNVSGASPLRMVLDRSNKTNLNVKVYNDGSPTVVFTKTLRKIPEHVQQIQLADADNPLKQILDYCYQNNIQNLMVEGGATLLQQFIEKDLWDKAHVLVGNITYGVGILAPVLSKEFIISSVGADSLLTYTNI